MKIIDTRCFGLVLRVNVNDGSGEIVNGFPRDTNHDSALDAIESLILAHACAGIDVCSPAYLEGIETAIDAISNN